MAITAEDFENMNAFYKVRKGFHDTLKVNVQIDHEQVDYLVVRQLMKVYMGRANDRPEHFKRCLLHFLTEDEFVELESKWPELSAQDHF